MVKGLDRWFDRCFDRASEGKRGESKNVVAIETTTIKLAINDLCTIESDLTIDLDNSPDAQLVHKVAKVANSRRNYSIIRHQYIAAILSLVSVQAKSCSIDRRSNSPRSKIIAIAIEPDILETRTPLQYPLKDCANDLTAPSYRQ